MPSARPPSQQRSTRASLPALASVEEEALSALQAACRAAAVGVLGAMWEEEVAHLCGERWRPRAGVPVARAGACACDVTLAGRRVRVRRPRVRSRRGEVELATYRLVSAGDVLDRQALETITACTCLDVAPRTGEPVRRRFLAEVAAALRGALAEPARLRTLLLVFGELRFREHGLLVGLGVTSAGVRKLLALETGSPENAEAVTRLLRSVATRTRAAPALAVVGESRPLARAVRRQLGASTPVAHCPVEKRRRVVGLLPAHAQAGALEALRAAYGLDDAARARRALQLLGRRWARQHPSAAAALREGLDETLLLRTLSASRPRPRRSTGAAPLARSRP